MNTIEDLRATLHHHATDLPDEADHIRSAAVHQRVRVARQRRRTAVAGGIAAIVALTVGASPGCGCPPRRPWRIGPRR